MRLALASNPTTFVDLDKGLLWEDEFKWSAVQRVSEYTIEGAMVVDVNKRMAGRPITLNGQGDEMGWITRADLQTLYGWADTEDMAMVLTLQYEGDTRSFNVAFRSNENQPIEADPVKKIPSHLSGDWFKVKIKLEVVS